MKPVFRIHEKTIRLAINEYPTETPNTLVIRNDQTILPFLRAFGHLITSLQHITKSFDSVEDTEEITNYIMQYCSDTITELELGSLSAALATNSSTVFKRLTKVKLCYWRSFDDTDINRNFPMLEELTIETSLPIPDSMAKFYPKLQRFNLISIPLDRNDASFKELLRFNPQLRELRLEIVLPFRLLEFISNELKDLEYLSIHYRSGIVSSSRQKIHFENLKGFSIQTKDWFVQPHQTAITFSHLETLEILTYDAGIPYNLVRDNFELKCISLPFATAATAKEILMQAGPFRGLEEVKIQWSNTDDTLIIRDVMDRFDSLKRIVLVVHVFRETELNLDAVKADFENEDGWKVTDHKFTSVYGGFDIYYVTLRK